MKNLLWVSLIIVSMASCKGSKGDGQSPAPQSSSINQSMAGKYVEEKKIDEIEGEKALKMSVPSGFPQCSFESGRRPNPNLKAGYTVTITKKVKVFDSEKNSLLDHNIHGTIKIISIKDNKLVKEASVLDSENTEYKPGDTGTAECEIGLGNCVATGPLVESKLGFYDIFLNDRRYGKELKDCAGVVVSRKTAKLTWYKGKYSTSDESTQVDAYKRTFSTTARLTDCVNPADEHALNIEEIAIFSFDLIDPSGSECAQSLVYGATETLTTSGESLYKASGEIQSVK